MPWCPNCKTEYREGITHCADCKVELVAEYKDVVLKNATALLVQVETEQQAFIEKLRKFLEYSGITSAVMEEEELTGVYVAPEDFNKAKKCFKAFYSVETEMVMQKAAEAAFLKGEEFDYFGDDEEEEDAAESLSEAKEEVAESFEEQKTAKHVSAASRYEDYRSSGYTFVILGGLGVAFALLNFMDVITVFGSGFSSTVLFVLFGIFLALGIFSFVKAGQLKEGAKQENELVASAKSWMQENFNEEVLADLTKSDTSSDEVNTEELLYMDRLDSLVKRLLDAFPNLHDSLAEQLVEEFIGQYEE